MSIFAPAQQVRPATFLPPTSGAAVFLAVVISCLPNHSAAAIEPNYPLGIVANEQGTIFLADRNLPGVLKLEGETLSVYFLAEKKFRTPLNAVRCVALDQNGKLLAGDSATREIYRFEQEGKPTPLTAGGIGIPMSIAVNKAGEIFVADLELHLIWKVPAAGGKPEQFASIPAPRGLAFDAQDRLWVVSGSKNQLFRVGADGKPENLVKGRPFEFPHQVVVDEQGTAYVTDGYARAIWKIPAGGEPTKLASGEPLVGPVGICRQGSRILVVDPRAKAVFEVTSEGKLTTLPLK